MNAKQKKTALIVGSIVAVLLLLWLLSRKGVGQTVVNHSAGMMPGVAAGSLGDIIINSGPISIPGINFGDRDLSMIGSCCMDCAAPKPMSYIPAQGSTFVYNAGNNGPNVYNYTQAAPSTGSSLSACPPYYEAYSYVEGGRWHTGCRPMGSITFGSR